MNPRIVLMFAMIHTNKNLVPSLFPPVQCFPLDNKLIPT